MIWSGRNTIVVGLAAMLAAWPLSSVTQDPGFVVGVVAVVLVLQLIAGVVRRFTAFGPAANLVQLLVLATGGLLAARLLGAGAAETIGEVLGRAAEHIATSPAPMPAEPSTLLVLLVAVGAVTIAIDTCFIAARSALATVLPLLAGYLTAMVVFDQPISPLNLVAVATGWCALLAARTLDHDRRWPRALTRGRPMTTNRVWFAGLAAALGIPAIALALVAGSALPTTGAPNWLPNGNQPGTVQLTDPTVELNRNLLRPQNRAVLTYTTSTNTGVHLRSSALTLVTPDGWGQIDMSLQTGFPSRVPGVGDIDPTLTTQVQIGEFDSAYLPSPYAPVGWQAEGLWNFDPQTLTVLRIDSQGVDGLGYTVDSRFAEPSVDEIANATAGAPPEGAVASEVPADVPPEIIELAQQITADADTAGRRAVALQDHLRNSELFRYDLTAPTGTGYDVLVDFLTTTRSGYCIHYAAAMALMARVVGIPARVAVGFTPGEQQPDGSWLVTAHDMHAWPELYLSGLGWVRFEPTVAVGIEPTYTDLPDPAEPTVPTEPTPTPTPEATTTPAPPTAAPEPVGPAGGVDIDWRWVLGVGGGLVLLASGALTRLALRRRRLGATGAEARVRGAWRELEASARDLGLPWPAVTPRQLAAMRWRGLDVNGRAALERVALLVERLRYSPGLPAEVSVADDVRLVRRQWLAAAGRRGRIIAAVAPRSLVPRRRPVAEQGPHRR